jgi:hypothetical protein
MTNSVVYTCTEGICWAFKMCENRAREEETIMIATELSSDLPVPTPYRQSDGTS